MGTRSFGRAAAAVGLALSALSCGDRAGDDVALATSGVGAAAGGSGSAAQDSSAVVRDPCVFDNSGRKCAGLLDRSFLQTRSAPNLKREANKALVAGQLVPREEHCNKPADEECNFKQSATPFVNLDSRSFSLEAVPNDKVIILGAIQFRYGVSSKDRYYKVGADLPLDAPWRMHYIVAYPVTRQTLPPPRQRDAIIGKWAMYRISGFGVARADSVASGNIVQCGHWSGGSDQTHFTTCAGQQKIQEAAAAQGAASHFVYMATACEWDQLRAVFDDGMNQTCAAQRDTKLKSMQAMLRSEMKVSLIDMLRIVRPAADPYWYECANGCCTAET